MSMLKGKTTLTFETSHELKFLEEYAACSKDDYQYNLNQPSLNFLPVKQNECFNEASRWQHYDCVIKNGIIQILHLHLTDLSACFLR